MHNILPDLRGHKNLESHAYYVSGCICGLTLAVVQHKHKIPDSHKKLLHKSLMVNSRMSCGGPPKGEFIWLLLSVGVARVSFDEE